MADDVTEDEKEEFTSYDRLVEITRIDFAEDFLHAWKELREIPGDGKHLTFPIVYKSERTSAKWLKRLQIRGSKESKLPLNLLRFTRFGDHFVTIIDMVTPMHRAVTAFFQLQSGAFMGAANLDSLIAMGGARYGTFDVPDGSWRPRVRTYPNPIPNGPALTTYVPSVVLQVGWSESGASLENRADAYLAMNPPVKAVILVKLVKGDARDRNRARIRENGDVAMRMKCKVVTAANNRNPNAAWTEFGSDIVNGAPRVAAPVPAVVGAQPPPTLDLNTADLYDGAVVPAGLPNQIQFPLLDLQEYVHDSYLIYLEQ